LQATEEQENREDPHRSGPSIDMVRRELWRQGLRFRLHQTELSGQPDIVFTKQRLAVFCDGDFWHSRNLSSQLAKLATGHNPVYWTAKIQKKC
jgi:DNA mismatch endonuclease, patch repair protein